MEIKKIKFILLILFVGVLIVTPQVYAKTSIEIKPSSSKVYTNKTISVFFDESMAMKNAGEGLEGANVDVHMSTNMDWAIVAYFSNSAYGTNGVGENVEIDVAIGNKTYQSTTGNITGVMDLGKSLTYTAGVLSNYTEISDTDTSTEYTNGRSIIANATNNKYVDLLNSVSGKDMAITGWFGADASRYNNIKYPFSVRIGLFGCVYGIHTYGEVANGKGYDYATFRPAIWN